MNWEKVELTKDQELEKVKKQNQRLLKMIEEEREKVAGHEQIAKVHSAYIYILLKRLGATKDNAVGINSQEIAEAIEKDEVRAFISEQGALSLYYEE